jgi:hypothetical protein
MALGIKFQPHSPHARDRGMGCREQIKADRWNPDNFIDPKGYWADLQRKIRSTSGEQDLVLTASRTCTNGEWLYVLESLELDAV